ncbi:MAG: antibiotic biosynthesis monooxygenase [Marinobacterium sp.]|nr:antibiotic biosynthesis monooxygenase [Marinobacterium sp.]
MAMELTIVARIEAIAGQTELLKAELLKLVEPTRLEEGCLQYDLHQDNDDPAVFLFYERWASRELWQVHMAAEHLKAYREATSGAVASFLLHEMTGI